VGFLDPGKLLVILVVALIVLGPERLPRVARQTGAAWRELTRVREQVTEEIRSAMPDLDLPSIPKMPTNMVSGFIADLTKPAVTATGAGVVGASEVQSVVSGPQDGDFSSSSSGGDGGDAETAGTGASGELGPEGLGWTSPPVRGRSGGWGVAPAVPSGGELPVAVDDPSMN
jgi:sec-independent protein translocase protein TatB